MFVLILAQATMYSSVMATDSKTSILLPVSKSLPLNHIPYSVVHSDLKFLYLAFSHAYVSQLFSADSAMQKQSRPLVGILSTCFAAQAKIPYHQNFLNVGLGI